MNNINEEITRTNNSNLAYSITGEGEPLILIHGNFNDSRIWKYQIECFSSQFQVISYDLRGYGKSSTPTSTFSHFEDLKELMDSLKIKKATIIGSSLGGSVAIDFALKYPEMVKALILAAPSVNGCRYPLKVMIEAVKSISSLKSKGFEYTIEKFINNTFWSYFIPSENRQAAREIVLETIKTQKNFYSWDFKLANPLKPYASRRIREIHVPTLIVISDKDKAFNIKIGEYLHKTVENSKIDIIKDCGHLLFVEKPEEFNRKVLDFLKGI